MRYTMHMTAHTRTKPTFITRYILIALIMAISSCALLVARQVGAATSTTTTLPCEQALLIGHRGTTIGVTRNNSLAAFQKAVADGAESIEMDIHRTKPINGSGTWVVWHDKTIQGKAITNYTFAQLKAIQPDLMTIREAFVYVSSTDRRMDVEVKPVAAGTGSFEYFASLVAQYNMASRFQLSSFDTTNLSRAKAQGLKVVYLSSSIVSPATVKKYGTIVHLNKSVVTAKSVVDTYHAAGVQVYVYTQNTEADWNKYLGYGVDGITTDLAANYVSYCNAQQPPVAASSPSKL